MPLERITAREPPRPTNRSKNNHPNGCGEETIKPAAFDYARPASVNEALTLLATGGPDGRIRAGGQSLVPMRNFRVARPSLLIDINRLDALDFHRISDGQLVFGALSRHATLHSSAEVAAACPPMAEAYRHVAHGPIQNRGTLCGSLCHADPVAEMSAVALATNAIAVLRSLCGEWLVPARDFFLGVYQTAGTPSD